MHLNCAHTGNKVGLRMHAPTNWQSSFAAMAISIAEQQHQVPGQATEVVAMLEGRDEAIATVELYLPDPPNTEEIGQRALAFFSPQIKPGSPG